MKNKIILILFFSIFFLFIIFFLFLIFGVILQLTSSTQLKPLFLKEIIFSIKLSFISALISSISAIILSIPIAYILSKYEFPFKNVLETILFLPIVAPPIALGAMLLIFFKTSVGGFFENNIFRVVYEAPGIIFAQLIVVFGISVNILKVIFNSIDKEYEDIARTLGANRIQAFFHILIPLSKKGIYACFFLSFARAIGEFGASVTLAGATSMKTETLPIAIFLSFSSADIYNACIFTLICLTVSFFTLYIIRSYKNENNKSIL